jgi:hypothetical protein
MTTLDRLTRAALALPDERRSLAGALMASLRATFAVAGPAAAATSQTAATAKPA